MQQVTLYGINHYMPTIERIIKDLHLEKHQFDIKLMLTEAITNAFKYGNCEDGSKPIKIRYNYVNENLKIEVEDSGQDCKKDLYIPDSIEEDNILNSYGRGLFLINSIADKVYYTNNTLIIHKKYRENKDNNKHNII